jgi:SAM-dependent methyltransferase
MQPQYPSPSQVRQDFDAIAELPKVPGDRGERYYARLLAKAPMHCARALDAGCGTGVFTRQLAARADSVLGIDLSPRMIDAARREITGAPSVDYRVADFMVDDIGGDYDVISSIATLHHVPLAGALARLAGALRPGGTLLVLDVLDDGGLSELPRNGVAWLLDRADRIARGWRGAGAEARKAWQAHDRHDRYDTWRDIRSIYAAVLPGADVRRHLFWRYSAVWHKPRPAV